MWLCILNLAPRFLELVAVLSNPQSIRRGARQASGFIQWYISLLCSPTTAEAPFSGLRRQPPIVMFSTTVRRLTQAAKEPASRLTMQNNPYKTRKVWPPNFEELTPQQQLRFEKKYKRRIYLASYSPKWDKGVRMVRFLGVSGGLQHPWALLPRAKEGGAYRTDPSMIQVDSYMRYSTPSLSGGGKSTSPRRRYASVATLGEAHGSP